MRPSFLDSLSYAMADVYASVTDKILVNIAKHFPFYDPEAETPGVFEYQSKMLAQMGQVRKETVDIITKNLEGADEALRKALEAAIMDALKDEEPKLRDAAQKGLLGTTEPPEVTPNQMNAFKMYYKQSADKLNLVNTVMLESTESAYRQTVSNICSVILKINHTQEILNASTGEVVTGVSAWNSAMHGAVQKMVENGLTGFIDHAGRRWSPEAYVAMDIKTTMFNTARESIWETADSFGSDLYQVSSHNGARPLCYPWQGKVISRSDRVREVTDLDGNKIHVYAQSETTYGQAAGLFGINCKHYPMTFIPGVSTLRGQPQDPEENEQAYAESQEQRALERKLRKEKLDLSILKAEGADEDEIKAQRDRVRKASADIDDFCDRTGRARRRNREYTPINATFPDKNSYDPHDFNTETRDRINSWYGNTGMNAPQPSASQPEQAQNPVQHQFIPAKTRQEAEQYAKQFADHVDYKGMSIENANEVNRTLTELNKKYPIKKLEHIEQKAIGSCARANYEHLEINGRHLGKILTEEAANFAKGQADIRQEIESIKERYAGKPKIPWDVERKITNLENKLKFKRFGVHSSYENHVGCIVTHEYGHIVSDHYFGMLNEERANPNYSTNWQLRKMKEKWNSAFQKSFETGDIYNLSEYGAHNVNEFFAESFAAREMGETLPDYVEELFVEVFKNGIM